MKKILIGIIMCSVLLGSCKKKLEEQFNNPEVYSNTGDLFGGMFTSMLYTWKVYIQDYGEWWWEIAGTGAMGVSGYTQVAQRYITDRYAWYSNFDDLSGTNGFGSENQLWQNRLGSFYTGMRAWAVIKDKLGAVTGQDLDDNQIYYSLATVVKNYSALLAVDFYNNIPYSEAFRGSDRVFFPKYDDPKAIYTSILADFKTIAGELPAQYAKMSPSAKAVFAVQDIAFKGDINKWVQYINALRLKYAVRISGVEDALAKTHIQEVLASNQLPTQDQLWSMPTKHDINGGGGYWNRGLIEAWPGTFIPNIIMKRMNRNSTRYEPGIDDPRLPVIAMPTQFSNYSANAAVRFGDYRGVSMNADAQKPIYTAGERYYTGGPLGDILRNLKENSRSMYNFATFGRNDGSQNYMMSLGELELLLAEVALKNLGNTGKTAGEHIKQAVVKSTDFWYTYNDQGSTYRVDSFMLHPAKPSAAIINTYADSIMNRFNTRANLEDKMEILMQQKYIHFNILAPYELWTELRRTRHPKLEPFTFNTKVMKPLPERLRYPTVEQQTNPDNYATVKAQDNFTTPIFWVPAAKRTEIPYWPDYNYD